MYIMRTIMHFWILYAEGSGLDYSVSTTSVSVASGTQGSVQFTLLQDNVAQEFNETFNLTLIPGSRTASNVFGATIEVVIIDASGMSIIVYNIVKKSIPKLNQLPN